LPVPLATSKAWGEAHDHTGGLIKSVTIPKGSKESKKDQNDQQDSNAPMLRNCMHITCREKGKQIKQQSAQNSPNQRPSIQERKNARLAEKQGVHWLAQLFTQLSLPFWISWRPPRAKLRDAAVRCNSIHDDLVCIDVSHTSTLRDHDIL